MSSNTQASAGGRRWSWQKATVTSICFVFLLITLVPPVKAWFLPPIDAGIRAINTLADRHEVAKVNQAKPELIKTVGGDDRTFGESLKSFGSTDNARRSDRYAAIARARGEVPVVPQAEVLGNQQGWVTEAPAFEPLHVTVPPTDTIKPSEQSEEESTAEGIYPQGLPYYYRTDQTVIMKDRLDRGMQMTNPGNLYELVGRICNEGACTPAMPMGTDNVVCAAGYFQGWYNGRRVIGRMPTLIGFSNGVGKYRLTIVPDEFARATCAEHPGETIVKINKPIATVVMAHN